jgi:hypothetical protein
MPFHKNGRYSVSGRIIRPKTGKIRPPIWVTHKKSLAKMAITWAFGLHFRWFWARWIHHNDLYKTMHRNIIVQ